MANGNSNDNNNGDKSPFDSLLPIVALLLIAFLVYQFVLLGDATINSIGH